MSDKQLVVMVSSTVYGVEELLNRVYALPAQKRGMSGRTGHHEPLIGHDPDIDGMRSGEQQPK